VLPTPGARAGVDALIDLAERSGLRRIDELLGDSSRRRGIGDWQTARQRSDARHRDVSRRPAP